jgi:hypothetical protein
MADEVDKANDMQAVILEMRIKAARKPLSIITTGYCFYCGDNVGEGMRWCGVECRDGWEREQ